MPHGAKPPNGESLETQKSKRPLSDSPGRLGVPEGCISHSVSQSSRPPLSSSFFVFFLLSSPLSFLPPNAFCAGHFSCWPLRPLRPRRPAGLETGGKCIREACLVPRALPPSPLGGGPERPHRGPVVLPRVTLEWRSGSAALGSGLGLFPQAGSGQSSLVPNSLHFLMGAHKAAAARPP